MFSALFWLKALIILPPRSLDSVGFTFMNLDVSTKIEKKFKLQNLFYKINCNLIIQLKILEIRIPHTKPKQAHSSKNITKKICSAKSWV